MLPGVALELIGVVETVVMSVHLDERVRVNW